MIHDGIIRASNKLLNTQGVVKLQNGVTPNILQQWFTGFIELAKTISMSNSSNTSSLCEYTQNMERALLNIPASSSDLHNPIIIWTGAEAMYSAMDDKEGICNLDAPITHLLFVLWKEIFCSQDPNSPTQRLSQIALDSDINAVASHPDIIELKNQIIRAKEHLSLHEISRQFLGSDLSDEEIKLAETMGVFASKFFIDRFIHSAPKAIFYFSNNKIDEYPYPVLAINTIAWDIELPLIRQKFGREITFRHVCNGTITEANFDDLRLVRNRYHEDVLQDRRIYTCGMTTRPELLFYSSVQARPTLAINQLKQMINHWSNKSRAIK